MPLYEYVCDVCGHRFEVIQKFSDPPIDACPKCGGAVQKVQSAPAFHLKGRGWYITDYAKKDASTAKTEDSASESKETKPSDAKEAKPTEPAAKTEAKTDKAETKTDKPATTTKSA
jgi:putative FmdB family regulatory protein